MNSCLYECEVVHYRKQPRAHRMAHKIFSFCLDLDELSALGQRLKLVSYNRFNLYSFRDQDYWDRNGRSVRENVIEFIRARGVDWQGGKIYLVTSLRVLGYVFNPVSFYFCFDPQGAPLCAVAEVHNTFGEVKPYFLSKECLRDGVFSNQQTKHFYISPFMDLDTSLEFKLRVPSERLETHVDDIQGGEKVLWASMTGQKKELSDRNILGLTLRYPLVTLQVIALIHWHALRLFLKKIPYHMKEHNPHLQKEVLRACRKS